MRTQLYDRDGGLGFDAQHLSHLRWETGPEFLCASAPVEIRGVVSSVSESRRETQRCCYRGNAATS